MKCIHCGKNIDQVKALYRLNETGPGIKGIWSCEEHVDISKVDKEVADITQIIIDDNK